MGFLIFSSLKLGKTKNSVAQLHLPKVPMATIVGNMIENISIIMEYSRVLIWTTSFHRKFLGSDKFIINGPKNED